MGEGKPGEGGDCALLFEQDAKLPLERRAWSDWIPLRRAETEAAVRQRRPSHNIAPMEDLLHMLLHVVPGSRIDVKATINTVGELEMQELPLQPGESTATRT